jgi:preprotein translocase subunit SecG
MGATTVIVALIVIGTVLILLSLSKGIVGTLSSISERYSIGYSISDGKAIAALMIILGIVFISIGGVTYYGTYSTTPATVTIGSGYINV